MAIMAIMGIMAGHHGQHNESTRNGRLLSIILTGFYTTLLV